MRHFIALIMIATFAISASAQRQYTSGFMEDTTTNAETVYLYPADAASAIAATNIREYGAMEVVMVYDSLTGNPAGTAVLQYCYDESCNYTYDAATLTLNGNTQVVSRTEDTEFTPLKFRIKITTTGTQTCRVRTWYYWKRKT